MEITNVMTYLPIFKNCKYFMKDTNYYIIINYIVLQNMHVGGKLGNKHFSNV